MVQYSSKWPLAVIVAVVLGTAIFFAVRKPLPPLEVERTKLVQKEGRLYQKESSVPFTGMMVDHYPGGVLQSRSAVSEGQLNGISLSYYTNGTLQVEEHFKEGVLNGLRTKWSESGARLSETPIQNGKITGTFRRWHENGKLAEEVAMVDGAPEGVSKSWYPSGHLKAEVTHANGEIVSRKSWSDGEGALLANASNTTEKPK